MSMIVIRWREETLGVSICQNRISALEKQSAIYLPKDKEEKARKRKRKRKRKKKKKKKRKRKKKQNRKQNNEL